MNQVCSKQEPGLQNDVGDGDDDHMIIHKKQHVEGQNGAHI